MFRSLHVVVGLVGLIALCACACVQAEPQAWQGKIGSVVMELDTDSTSVEDRYFYRKENTAPISETITLVNQTKTGVVEAESQQLSIGGDHWSQSKLR